MPRVWLTLISCVAVLRCGSASSPSALAGATGLYVGTLSYSAHGTSTNAFQETGVTFEVWPSGPANGVVIESVGVTQFNRGVLATVSGNALTIESQSFDTTSQGVTTTDNITGGTGVVDGGTLSFEVDETTFSQADGGQPSGQEEATTTFDGTKQ
jgi:hypothetical protein